MVKIIECSASRSGQDCGTVNVRVCSRSQHAQEHNVLKVTMWMSPSSLEVIHAWGHSVLKVSVLPGCRNRCVSSSALGLAAYWWGHWGLSGTEPDQARVQPCRTQAGVESTEHWEGSRCQRQQHPEGVLHLDMGIRGGPGSASGLNLCAFEGAPRNGWPSCGVSLTRGGAGRGKAGPWPVHRRRSFAVVTALFCHV